MSTNDEVHDAWRRIETWLGAHAPGLAKGLEPPASAEEVAKAEVALGVTLPPELRASLSIHNGQSKHAFEVLGTWGLLSLSGMERIWQMLCGVAARGLLSETDDPENALTEGPVRPRSWDRRWIPFATSGTGDYLLLDLNPPPEGRVGQVVSYEKSSTFRAVVAPDLGVWLAGRADALERGDFEVSPSREQIYPRDDD